MKSSTKNGENKFSSATENPPVYTQTQHFCSNAVKRNKTSADCCCSFFFAFIVFASNVIQAILSRKLHEENKFGLKQRWKSTSIRSYCVC